MCCSFCLPRGLRITPARALDRFEKRTSSCGRLAVGHVSREHAADRKVPQGTTFTAWLPAAAEHHHDRASGFARRDRSGREAFRVWAVAGLKESGLAGSQPSLPPAPAATIRGTSTT